ncbi:MAG: 2-amino-4-hydroxy-6-hydroxymethyldihydropteridine diphosphokinase [Ginsengibacter sp.]
MNTVYVLTGGNLGNKYANLLKAKEYLQKETGNIVASSSIYQTKAWGNNNQPDFFNQVHIIKTNFSAEKLMKKILEIEEEQMGRIRTEKNAARLIDIDILFFNDEVINKKNLIIPHAEISNRRFVLTPLNELSPSLIHPVLHKTVSELLAICKDALEVKLVSTV